jgi:hypothetical protein
MVEMVKVLLALCAIPFHPEKEASEEMDTQHGDEEQPGDLEGCNSKAEDHVSFNSPVTAQLTASQKGRMGMKRNFWKEGDRVLL